MTRACFPATRIRLPVSPDCARSAAIWSHRHRTSRELEKGSQRQATATQGPRRHRASRWGRHAGIRDQPQHHAGHRVIGLRLCLVAGCWTWKMYAQLIFVFCHLFIYISIFCISRSWCWHGRCGWTTSLLTRYLFFMFIVQCSYRFQFNHRIY